MTRFARLLPAPMLLLCSTQAAAAPVTFTVEVPHCTPADTVVNLRSNRLDANTFTHDAMTRIDSTHYEGTFEVTIPRSAFAYRYSHGMCDATACPGIEKSVDYTGSGGDLAERHLAEDASHATDLVFIWRDSLKWVDGPLAGIYRSAQQQTAFCGPYLSVSEQTGNMRLSYDSFQGAAVRVDYGLHETMGNMVHGAGTYRNHFELHGLQAGEVYYYRITDGTFEGPVHTFRAPPAATQMLRVGFVGDVQYYSEQDRQEQFQISDLLSAFGPDLLLSAGDLVASTDQGAATFAAPELGRWNTFFGVMAPLMARAPFMVAMGNHEEDAAYFWDVFNFPVTDAPKIDHYDFTYGPLFAAALYTGVTRGYDLEGILDSQTAWLEAALIAANNNAAVRWKILFVHRGPFSEGASHPHDGNAFFNGANEGRPSWIELAEQYGVDLVLAGHNHNLTVARHHGVQYVTACSGAPIHSLRGTTDPTTQYAEETCTANLLELSDTALSFRAMRPDGSAIPEASFDLCTDNTDCHAGDSTCAQCVEGICVDGCGDDGGRRDGGGSPGDAASGGDSSARGDSSTSDINGSVDGGCHCSSERPMSPLFGLAAAVLYVRRRSKRSCHC